MKTQFDKRDQAIVLRQQGFSLQEIAKKANISKSTASIWLKDVFLSKEAKNRINKRILMGQRKAIKYFKTRRDKTTKSNTIWAEKIFKRAQFNKEHCQILCAMLYWAEGAKFTDSRMEFTNSDPNMIRVFIKLLRKGFDIDNNKIRVNIHVHEYHNEAQQKNFWSKITNIPLSQFNKSYLKSHTKKIIRKDYPGCVRICYYSAKTAKKIKALYQTIVDYI